MDYGGIKVHRHEILPPHFFGLVSCLGSHDLVCPLFRNIFSYSMEVMSFLCSLWRRVKVPFSGAVRSEIAHCALCHHPMSRATRSVSHKLTVLTPKNIMNQSPYRSYTKVKCSNLSGSRPSNGHPLSGVTQSVTTRCLGQHGNSIGQLRVSYKNSKFSTKLKGQIMNMPF